MALTLRAVLGELDRLSTQGEIDEIGRDEIVDSVARAALLGARGNSGVILSQLLRGAAEELISRPGELVDPVLVAAAMARAADRAYSSVRDPAEGTILTVVREMAARVASEVAHMDEPRLHTPRRRRGPERDDRRGARGCAPLGRAVGGARPGAAADPARGGRRRRRRLRPDRDVRGRDRGAARHRGAEARPPHAGPHHAPGARVDDLPLLHQLRGHRRGPRPGPLERPARATRRLGAGGRRQPHAEGPSPHRRARPRHRAVRGDRRRLAPRRGGHDRPGAGPQRAPRRGDAGVGRAERGGGRRDARAVRGPRRRGARRREHAQPLDLRAARRHPRRCRPRASWSCRTRRT